MVLWPECVGQAEKDPTGMGGTKRGVNSWPSCHEPELGKVAIERASTPNAGWGRESAADLGSGPPTGNRPGDKHGSEHSRRRGFLVVELFTGS